MDVFLSQNPTSRAASERSLLNRSIKISQLVSVDGLGVREAIARCVWEPHHALLRSNPGISEMRYVQPCRLPSGRKKI